MPTSLHLPSNVVFPTFDLSSSLSSRPTTRPQLTISSSSPSSSSSLNTAASATASASSVRGASIASALRFFPRPPLASSTIVLTGGRNESLLKRLVKAALTLESTPFRGSSPHAAFVLNLVMSVTNSKSSRTRQ